MDSKVICSIKTGVNINDILPEFTASNQQQIGVKRLYDLSIPLEKYISKNEDNGMNTVSRMSDEELITVAIDEMTNYEKRVYNTFELDLPQGIDINKLIDYLNDHELVNYAEIDEKNFKEEILLDSDEPNDPLFGELYGIKNIECLTAWKKTEGENIVVAVVDSGVDYNHPDIKNNMWRNKDGAYGYNFVDNTIDPMDDDGHGSHVAGTIAATGNNSTGIIGVAPKTKIMALKGLSPSGGYSSDLGKCIKYAADKGAHIINNSWGPGRSNQIKDAIEYADRKGCIVIFAAGNSNSKITKDMAAGNPRTISVAAINKRDSRASFSNYGPLVDISAPGVSIKSLKYKTRSYVSKSGTSMACPHVSGLVSLMKSINGKASKKEILANLQESVDSHFTEKDKPIGTGRINARKAVKITSNSEENFEEVKSYDTIINESSQLYLVNLYFSQNKVAELKFSSISELNACVQIMASKNIKYSFADQSIILS